MQEITQEVLDQKDTELRCLGLIVKEPEINEENDVDEEQDPEDSNYDEDDDQSNNSVNRVVED